MHSSTRIWTESGLSTLVSPAIVHHQLKDRTWTRTWTVQNRPKPIHDLAGVTANSGQFWTVYILVYFLSASKSDALTFRALLGPWENCRRRYGKAVFLTWLNPDLALIVANQAVKGLVFGIYAARKSLRCLLELLNPRGSCNAPRRCRAVGVLLSKCQLTSGGDMVLHRRGPNVDCPR